MVSLDEPAVKVGDLIMTGPQVAGYMPYAFNKMAIIRGVVARHVVKGEERYAHSYYATLLDSGRQIELWRHEFEPTEGDTNHG